jgi:hypothetical protein
MARMLSNQKQNKEKTRENTLIQRYISFFYISLVVSHSLMKIGGDLPPFFGVNAALAAALYLVDVGLNSAIEYGDLPGQDASDNSSDAIVSL